MNKSSQNIKKRFIDYLNQYHDLATLFGETEYLILITTNDTEKQNLEGKGTGLLNDLLFLFGELIQCIDDAIALKNC